MTQINKTSNLIFNDQLNKCAIYDTLGNNKNIILIKKQLANICEKLKHHGVTLIPLSSSVAFVGSTIASISNENLLRRAKQSQIFSIFPRQRKFDKVKYIRLMYLQQLLPKV
jgi:hypothetical protein